MKLFLATFAAVSLATPALGDDDTPTRAQRASVMKAIKAVGCSNPTSIERDDGGYEVDNARCKDGVYDLKLSSGFKVISRDRDDND